MPIILILCLLLIPLPSFAGTTDEAREELRGTLSQIKASEERRRALEEKTQRLESERSALQRQMVSLAKQTSEREEELASYEEKLHILEEQKKEKSVMLTTRRAELSGMIAAMIKLRQLPPEAVIAMPGKLDETLATARALGVVSKAIQEEAESLKQQLYELEALEKKIRQSRAIIASKDAELETRQKQLAAKVDDRSKLEATLGGKERLEKERAAQLMAKSENLQDLLDSLEKSERNAWEHESPASAVKKSDRHAGGHKLRSFADKKGQMRLPPGRIISHFGNSSGGSFSKGIVIDTRAGTEVVAPFDAEVVFAGPFRDYGRMVILRHSNDYHTLLAGMSLLNCTPGQFLIEGEPIGIMGKHSGANHLYMELRRQGKPVDPLPWFKS